MKKAEKQILLEGLRKLAADVMMLADALEGKPSAVPVPAESATNAENTSTKHRIPEVMEQSSQAEPVEQNTQAEQKPEKTYTFEEARGILADKARMGFSNEVRAILKANGVNKLSEISDPVVMAKVVQEAEAINHG